MTSVYAPGLVPMDFHAVAEVLLDGQWYVVDGTGLAPRPSMVRIASGRDAADTAFLDSIRGQFDLISMAVEARIEEGLPADDGVSPTPSAESLGGDRSDVDPDRHRRARGVGEDHALEGRHVPEVAPPGRHDVPTVTEVVIGRVQIQPGSVREHHRRPGVGGVRPLKFGLARRRLGLEIAGHVPRRQSGPPQEPECQCVKS